MLNIKKACSEDPDDMPLPIEEEEFINEIEMVSVGSFEIAKNVISQAYYEEIIGNNPSFHKVSKEDEDNYPVENVTWEEAIIFCNELSKKYDLECAYVIKDNNIILNQESKGYRLPSREEWLFAANGGEEKEYNYSGSDNIDAVAWWEGDDPTGTHKIADSEKKPNKYGIYDMSGNVWELGWEVKSGLACCFGGAFDSYEKEINLNSKRNTKLIEINKRQPNVGLRVVRSL